MRKSKFVAVVYGRSGGRFVRLGHVLHIRRPQYLYFWLSERSYKFKDWTRIYLYDSETFELVDVINR